MIRPGEPHPWLRPLYRRVVTTMVCLGWVAIELWWGGDGLWLVLALAALGWAIWDFFLSGTYRDAA